MVGLVPCPSIQRFQYVLMVGALTKLPNQQPVVYAYIQDFMRIGIHGVSVHSSLGKGENVV